MFKHTRSESPGGGNEREVVLQGHGVTSMHLYYKLAECLIVKYENVKIYCKNMN